MSRKICLTSAYAVESQLKRWFTGHVHINMKMNIPEPARKIIDRLNEHGYEAYVVGGCVRDMILKREPGDWDITTSARPEQVKALFTRTLDTGIQHGTVTIMVGKEGYEVTTFRVDGDYTDGRHPDTVTFTPSLEEDLKRRDFTINAMAYNHNTGLVDIFGGREDIDRKVIRCVGNPTERFTEDALRILRAIRFSAQLGFSIEERTYEAIRTIAPNMVHVSKERIQVELTKLLLSSHPDYISLVYETGISPFVSEKFHGAYAADSGDWAVPSIPAGVPAVKHMRWAAFLRECSASQAAGILKDLKLDNDTSYRVRTLVEWQGKKIGVEDGGEDCLKHGKEEGMKEIAKQPEPSRASIRRAMSQMEPELFDDLLTLKMCLSEDASDDRESRWLCRVRDLTEEIRSNRDCISLKTLAVSGHDIMGAGVKPGREVGNTLARLLDMVLEEPQRNTREYLLAHLGQSAEK